MTDVKPIEPARMTGSGLNRTPTEVLAHLLWLHSDLHASIVGDTIEVSISETHKWIGIQSKTYSGMIWSFRVHEVTDWGNGPEWEESGVGGGMDHMRDFRRVAGSAATSTDSTEAFGLWLRAGEPEDEPMSEYIAEVHRVASLPPDGVLRRALTRASSTSIRLEFRSASEAGDHAKAMQSAGISCGRDRDAIHVRRSEFERLGVL